MQWASIDIWKVRLPTSNHKYLFCPVLQINWLDSYFRPEAYFAIGCNVGMSVRLFVASTRNTMAASGTNLRLLLWNPSVQEKCHKPTIPVAQLSIDLGRYYDQQLCSTKTKDGIYSFFFGRERRGGIKDSQADALARQVGSGTHLMSRTRHMKEPVLGTLVLSALRLDPTSGSHLHDHPRSREGQQEPLVRHVGSGTHLTWWIWHINRTSFQTQTTLPCDWIRQAGPTCSDHPQGR